jgi:hypothetical protein
MMDRRLAADVSDSVRDRVLFAAQPLFARSLGCESSGILWPAANPVTG